MLRRFEGEEGRRRLVEALRAQVLVAGDTVLAEAVAAVATLLEVSTGEIIIRQGGADNDLYMLLTGKVRIVVNGRDVASRNLGQHLGEMAILDPAAPRSATVIASETCVLAKISEPDFVKLANAHSYMWKMLAIQLSRRLIQRQQFHKEPNKIPRVFIGSSKECLPIAEAIAAGIPDAIAESVIWSQGVFAASHFVIDDLDAQLRSSDFAVLVAGADDQVTSRGVQSDAPRDNVVFELGLFMGALTRYRTFLAIPRDTKIKMPSDVLGLNYLVYEAAATESGMATKNAVSDVITVIQNLGPK